jgi:hypothetical protein
MKRVVDWIADMDDMAFWIVLTIMCVAYALIGIYG